MILLIILIVMFCLAALFLLIGSPVPEGEKVPAVLDSTSLERKLRGHRVVRRLLGNRSWAPAAEAAIEFFLRGKDCPNRGWRKSGTWAQVEMVYNELTRGPVK